MKSRAFREPWAGRSGSIFVPGACQNGLQPGYYLTSTAPSNLRLFETGPAKETLLRSRSWRLSMANSSLRAFLFRLLSGGRSARENRPPAMPTGRKRLARQLVVEQLEDRTVLASLLEPVLPFQPTLPHSDSAGGVSQIKNS